MSNLSPKVKVVCTYESVTETTELRHNALIELLKHFKQYQGHFDKTDSPKEAVITGNIRVNINHINQAVVVLTDVLNMPAGSMNDINLYRLLQCYLLDPDKRQKINQVLNNHIGQNTNQA